MAPLIRVNEMVQVGIYESQDPNLIAPYTQWAGRAPDNVLNYINNDSWSGFASSVPWQVQRWQGAGVASIWSVPLTVWGTSLEQVATGAYDSYFQAAANALAQAVPSKDGNIYVRLGWEFNGTWMPWAAQGHEAAFIKTFQDVVDIFRSVSDKFKFVWDVNEGGSTIDPAKAYPGDHYVDVVGMDTYYNKAYNSADPAKAFQDKVVEPYGLQWQQDFAAAHGKPTAISEWGVQTDDSAPFVKAMADWMSSHHMVYGNYWDSNDAGFNGRLDNGQSPNAAAAYLDAFANAPSMPTPSISSVSGLLNHEMGHVISGTLDEAKAGLTVTLRDGNTVLGSAVSDGAGHFSLAFTDTKDGATHSYTLSAATTSAAGETITSLSQSFTFDYSSNKSYFGAVAHDTSSHLGQVSALYEGLLGRALDQAGAQAWVSQLDHGLSLSSVTREFLASAEGQSHFASGTSNAVYVETLYETVLGRHGDMAGAQTWVGQLNAGVSRADVANQFVLSAEHQGQLQPMFSAGVYLADATDAAVARLYYGLLGRAPDETGLLNWETSAHAGLSASAIAREFIATAEYAALHPTTQTNQQFVESLYLNALGRPAEQPGEQVWLNALSHGASWAEVAVSILQSQEAQTHLAGHIEQGWHLL